MATTLSPFLIRSAAVSDLKDIFVLARLLDSYNLPADRRRLRRLVEDSELSFAGKMKDPARARYLFALEDVAARRVIGCALIVGKHGTPGLPHIYMTSFVE